MQNGVMALAQMFKFVWMFSRQFCATLDICK
jgi:hypothetical protein